VLKAVAAFARKNYDITTDTRKTAPDTIVWLVATYGCESWTMKRSHDNRLETSEMNADFASIVTRSHYGAGRPHVRLCPKFLVVSFLYLYFHIFVFHKVV